MDFMTKHLFQGNDFNVSLFVQMPIDAEAKETSASCNWERCAHRIGVFEKFHELKAGPRRAPQCGGLQVGDVEKDFPGHDSLGQFHLSLLQEILVE